jgi:hypothetical protein
MSKSSPPPALNDDGMLWQLLKAYANEDWDERAEPWPRPAIQFLEDASQADAAQLAEEIAATQALAMDDAGWQALLSAAEVDWTPLAHPFGLTRWAQDLRDRALAAAYP